MHVISKMFSKIKNIYESTKKKKEKEKEKKRKEKRKGKRKKRKEKMKQVTIIAICLYINGQIMKYSFSFIVKYYTNSPFNDRAKWVKSCKWIIASKAPTVSLYETKDEIN